jgi:hypothetical protein
VRHLPVKSAGTTRELVRRIAKAFGGKEDVASLPVWLLRGHGLFVKRASRTVRARRTRPCHGRMAQAAQRAERRVASRLSWIRSAPVGPDTLLLGDAKFLGSRVARRVLTELEAPMIDYPIGIEHFVRRIEQLITDLQNSKEGRRMLLKLLIADRQSFRPQLPDLSNAAE